MEKVSGSKNGKSNLLDYGLEFKLSSQAKEFLETVEGPIAVITVVGKYREGKSFLVDKLSGHQGAFTTSKDS